MDWSKPENRWGAIVGAVLGAGFLYGLYLLLPFLITIAANTLYLGLLVAVIGVLFYVVVLDSTLRTMLKNWYLRAMRALHILTFGIDPTGGLGVRIKEIDESIEEAEADNAKLNGHLQRVNAGLDRINGIYEKGLARAEAAMNRGRRDEAEAEGIKAEAARRNAEPLKTLKGYLEEASGQTVELIRKAKLQRDVLSTVIEVERVAYESSSGAARAAKSAMKALKGDAASNDLFEMNRQYLRDQTAFAVGEFKATLEANKSFLDSIDLDRASYSDAAFKELEARRRGALTAIDTTSDAAKRLLTSGQSPTTQAPAGQPGNFEVLFNQERK